MKLHGFHGKLLFDFKEWDVPTQILISKQKPDGVGGGKDRLTEAWFHLN